MQRRNLKLCCNATLIAIRARYDRAPAGHSAVDFHISGRCTDGIYYRLRRIVVIYIGIHELDYSRVITPLLAGTRDQHVGAYDTLRSDSRYQQISPQRCIPKS